MADAGSLFDSSESEDSVEYGCYSVTVILSKPAPYRYSLVLMDLHMPVRLKVTDICPWSQLTFSFMDRLGDGWIRGNENH